MCVCGGGGQGDIEGLKLEKTGQKKRVIMSWKAGWGLILGVCSCMQY